MNQINVLYVDDEIHNLTSFTANFRKGFNILTALSAEIARGILTSTDIHVLITDQRMPGTTGTVLLSEAVKSYPNVSRILLTGYADEEALKEAINIGHIYQYVNKPYDRDNLKECIISAHNICILKREQDANLKRLQEIEASLLEALKNKNIP